MKKQIKNLLNSLGYSVVRTKPVTDLDLYHGLFPVSSITGRHFYNLGAGKFQHPCWTNIDRNSLPGGADHKSGFIKFDFFSLDNLPIKDGTAELVYCSHVLGHIHNHAAKYLINEAFRILKPGGTFRVVTANIDLMHHAWINNDTHFFYWKHSPEMNRDYRRYGLRIPMKQASLSQVFLEEFAASASEIAADGAAERISDKRLHQLFRDMPYEQALDYCVSLCPVELQSKHPFRHMNWFNERKLGSFLTEAGFSRVYRSQYLQSRVPVFRNSHFFDSTVPQLSLYMEAQK